MKILDRITHAINRIRDYWRLESGSDDLILQITNVDAKRLPHQWRKAARVLLEDLYWEQKSELNNASAAIIKLAYFCHGYRAIHDNYNFSRIASAITTLRISSEGKEITEEASEFAYTFAGV